MQRGEIWWARLGTPRASEPGYRRPVLIVQSDEFTRSRIGTVVCAVVSSNTRLAGAPGNVRLDRKQSGLPRTSVVNVSQIVTVDRRYLEARVKTLGRSLFAEVESGLRLVLAL